VEDDLNGDEEESKKKQVDWKELKLAAEIRVLLSTDSNEKECKEE
jgi:hypothetical protein